MFIIGAHAKDTEFVLVLEENVDVVIGPNDSNAVDYQSFALGDNRILKCVSGKSKHPLYMINHHPNPLKTNVKLQMFVQEYTNERNNGTWVVGVTLLQDVKDGRNGVTELYYHYVDFATAKKRTGANSASKTKVSTDTVD